MYKFKILLLLFLFVPDTFGQIRLDVELLSNFPAKNNIVQLEVSDLNEKSSVFIGWQNSKGQQGSELVYIKPGLNEIDFSHQPSWNSTITYLATNNPKASARLIKKSIKHEFSVFFKKANITPGSINFIPTYIFLGLKFRHILLGIFILSSILFLIAFRAKVLIALFAGLIVASLFSNIRVIKTEWDYFEQIEENKRHLQPFSEVAEFVDDARKHMDGKQWTKEKLNGVLNSYVKYHLSDLPYIDSKKAKKGDLVITNKPGKRNVIFSKNNFYLVEK